MQLTDRQEYTRGKCSCLLRAGYFLKSDTCNNVQTGTCAGKHVLEYLVFWTNILVDLDSIHSGWYVPKGAPTQHQHHNSHARRCKYCPTSAVLETFQSKH